MFAICTQTYYLPNYSLSYLEIMRFKDLNTTVIIGVSIPLCSYQGFITPQQDDQCDQLDHHGKSGT